MAYQRKNPKAFPEAVNGVTDGWHLSQHMAALAEEWSVADIVSRLAGAVRDDRPELADLLHYVSVYDSLDRSEGGLRLRDRFLSWLVRVGC